MSFSINRNTNEAEKHIQEICSYESNSVQNIKSFLRFSSAHESMKELYSVNYLQSICLIWLCNSFHGFQSIMKGIRRLTLLHPVCINWWGEPNLKLNVITPFWIYVQLLLCSSSFYFIQVFTAYPEQKISHGIHTKTTVERKNECMKLNTRLVCQNNYYIYWNWNYK
jgi:hypothetical protein